jgi:formylglycine-generating enzyme required for sulfatase activity
MGSAEGTGRPDERPQHEVVIPRPFAVGRYALTFAEWDVCTAAGGCRHQPDDYGWGRGGQPVINVSWEDVQDYIAWLRALTAKPYRLLSEAEWEYAARAGSRTRYPWGDEPGTSRANFIGSGSRWSGEKTAPVGSFEPNAFGLFDMSGNVEEWVQDCWNDDYRGSPLDGSAWEDGDCAYRVMRGGSWNGGPRLAESVARNRGRMTPRIYTGGLSFRQSTLGCRLGRTL